jgi:hypothetical protein
LLDYNPETGALTWKPRDRWWFIDDHQWKVWNAKFAGQKAGALAKQSGGRRYYLHVVIFGHN